MKFKKLMFTASSLAVGASLLGTILTSCSCSSSTVDDKLKISLDDNGFLSNEKTQADFKKAVIDALSRSTNWATFKAALADEIVYRWYLDRAAENKDSKTKNSTFRVNLDEWTEKINKDYEETIKSLKNKYGSKYEFYLQNEQLAPNGGTEESYKHAKLVEKVRAEFISKVFSNNYFGYKTGSAPAGDRTRFEHIFSPASINLAEDELNNPKTWSDLGFYARTNSSFTCGDDATIDSSFLAKNPDGDYATIQQYVFDRWFKTEKPFFSAAALFKYSNPKYVAEGKLSEIYNGVSTGVKIPDNPSEAFPFFGGYASTESGKGTRAYAAWFEKLYKDGFATTYQNDEKDWVTNQTISIPKTMTEDSQTLLLCFGSQMIGGSANSLYIPYANAAASLYLQMITGNSDYAPKNSITQEYIKGNMPDDTFDPGKDNSAILHNFMFNDTETAIINNIKSYTDLTVMYPSGKGTQYHCPLFRKDSGYTFLYGDDSTDGVKKVTNTVQVDLGKWDSTKSAYVNTQPWILELNEAGMHAQTIDGYQYVSSNAIPSERQKLLKNVVKYRLMQKKCGYNDAIISADVFGDSGKLKTYFNDNFTDIILEMAFNSDPQYNIFRSIESYKTEEESKNENNWFLKSIAEDNKFNDYKILISYIDATQTYDATKKYFDAYETANSKTYAYRTKQVENARTTEKHLTLYENGLLAPIAYTCADPDDSLLSRVYNTSDITLLTRMDSSTGAITKYTYYDVANAKTAVVTEANKLATADQLIINADTAFSPQVALAKQASSNRSWYKSHLVDRFMYSYMSNKEGMTNYIKTTAMDQYTTKGTTSGTQPIITSDMLASFEAVDVKSPFLVTYAASKLFTGDLNYSNVGAKTDSYDDLYNKMNFVASSMYNYKTAINGNYADHVLNWKTFITTIAYLIGRDKSFEKFYEVLNTKISEDEMALVGYVSKTNKNIFGSEAVNKPSTLTSIVDTYANGNPYYWTADVNNIFDSTGYAGGDVPSAHTDSRIASDQYWKVLRKTVGKKTDTTEAKDIGLAGFTGIQTKASNQLDSASKLQEAAFDKFAKCSNYSRVLSNKVTKYVTADGKYENNYGCWFNFAGTKDAAGNNFKFADVTCDKGTVTVADFIIAGTTEYSPALKLAKKIAEYNTLDDLRSLAKKLGAAYYGDTEFRHIGDGTTKINDINLLKYTMLNELKDSKYLCCFERMYDAELHSEGSDLSGERDYGFTDDKGNTYRLLFTQINKADVTELTIAPEFKDGQWVQKANSPLSTQEFWYILYNMAMESSVQQLAIADCVKTVYGDDKLIVYDAQLYNTFDSVWIKDWSKKTIGV